MPDEHISRKTVQHAPLAFLRPTEYNAMDGDPELKRQSTCKDRNLSCPNLTASRLRLKRMHDARLTQGTSIPTLAKDSVTGMVGGNCIPMTAIGKLNVTFFLGGRLAPVTLQDVLIRASGAIFSCGSQEIALGRGSRGAMVKRPC